MDEHVCEPSNCKQGEPVGPMLHGKIVVSEHARFDEARAAWNLAVDHRPAAVVFAESPADVVATAQFAQEHGQRPR